MFVEIGEDGPPLATGTGSCLYSSVHSTETGSAQATLLLHKIEISNIYISLLISLITWMIEVHTMTEGYYSLYMVK